MLGGFVIFRREVRPFTDKQIELVQNFAAQAVIAIENTRLLNELRAVTGAADGHCGRAQVISSSTVDLQTVFQTCLLKLAARLCEAEFGRYLRRMARYSYRRRLPATAMLAADARGSRRRHRLRRTRYGHGTGRFESTSMFTSSTSRPIQNSRAGAGTRRFSDRYLPSRCCAKAYLIGAIVI